MLQERVERRFLVRSGPDVGGVELTRNSDQLLEVLEPALGLDRTLGLERVAVADVVEQRVEQVADGNAFGRPLAQGREHACEPPECRDRRLAEPRDRLRVERDLEYRLAGRLRVAEDAADRRLAEAALR